MFLISIFLYALLLTLSSEESKAELTTSSTPTGKVTIAYNIGNPPLKYTNQQGEADGILVDIWRLWSKKTGIEVEFKEALFRESLEMIKKGEADIHAGLFHSKERENFLDYSSPLVDINYYSFHHEQLPALDTLDTLIPFRIGVPRGYTHTFVKERLPNAAVAVYDNFPTLYDSAMAGSIQVFISPVMNLEYHLKQKGLSNPFRYNATKPVYSRTYQGAVQEGNQVLLDVVNRGLAQISAAERIDIERSWFKRIKGDEEQEAFIIACDSDYAPITMLNARGEPAGLFVDIWKKWAEKEGVQVHFLFDTWENSMLAVKEGLADVHSGLENNDPWLVASRPFYKLSARVFFPREKQFLSLNDLTGRKVASIDPFYAEVLKKANPALEVVSVKDYVDLFGKMRRGEVEAFIDDELAVEDLLLRQGRQGEFAKITDYSSDSSISAAVNQKNRLLLERINRGLQSISMEEYRQLENKWLRNPAQGYYHSLEKGVPLTAEEQQWLREHPVIRIGVDKDYAPYAFLDKEGSFQGVAGDYAKLISQKLGVRLEVVPGLSWPEILEGAKNRTLDVITTASWRPEREAYLAFSQGYIPTPLVIMSRSDDTTIRNHNDLKGRRVALVTEYSSSKRVLEEVPSIEVVAVSTPLEGLQALATGQADAYVGVLGINVHQAKQHGISNLKVAAPYDLNTNYQRYGVRKDWPQLATILDKALDTISEEKKLAILSRWIPIKDQSATPLPLPILSAEEKAFIKNHPLLRLGVDPEFFPFEYLDQSGSYSGITSDYIQLLNKRLGLKMQIVPDLSWDEVISKSKKREVDILPCVGQTKERQTYLNFSAPYLNFQRVVIARSDFPFISGLEELQDVRLAVQANTSHDGFLRDNTDLAPLRFATLQDALTAVSSGEADAVVGNLATSTFWIRKLNLTNLKVAAPVQAGSRQSLYFAVRQDWPELVSILNKGLSSITAEEEAMIYQKWVSVEYEQGIAPKTVLRYILKIAAGSLLLFLAFFVWNYRLKKEIMQRKNAEDKLHHYAEELEKANVHLKSLDQLKSMFIASMSHELRTPLNSIIGFTGVILQGMTGEINERQKDQLSRVYRSAKHLLSLITDVIDISKIEAGRIEVFPEPFLLAEVVDEAVENIQPQLKAKQLFLKLELAPNLQLTTDRKRLLQCLINYLSNSVKFTEEGGITVTARELGNKVEIRVTDTGIGIAQEDITKLFEPFERLETHLRVKAGGTGLGLYLTKKITSELLQGAIMVTSQPGKGSTFGMVIMKDIGPSTKE
ncbi:transporter substrate-binding domain-containing protein [Desulfogranum mediterraneum]|uniref:transporter substrate-binding domain-containing protein n=1 Tax=Desulfogranum mediterraneum TaxID=160661 RepID=UPI0013780E18|nr:transporter substrate-binding domain-containing protein [Desulfogranum mediterraneum]